MIPISWKMWWSSLSLTDRHRAVFFRTLGALYQAGISIDRSLECLGGQSEHPLLAEAAAAMGHKLGSGHRLSRCMAQYPAVFRDDHWRLVLVGEESGSLGETLVKIADREEASSAQAMKLKSALLPPVFISLVCLAMILVGPPLILRGLLETLQQNGTQLPWPTQLLIGASNALRSGWLYFGLAVGAIGLVGGFTRLRRHPQGQLRLESLLLHLPVVGKVARLAVTCRVVESLGASLELGMPLLQSLELAGGASGSPWAQGEMAAANARVREGFSLRQAFAQGDFDSPVLLQALEAGETSGQVSGSLASCGALLRMVLTEKVELLTGFLEPAVLCFVGGVVAFTVVATLLPMVKMFKAL